MNRSEQSRWLQNHPYSPCDCKGGSLNASLGCSVFLSGDFTIAAVFLGFFAGGFHGGIDKVVCEEMWIRKHLILAQETPECLLSDSYRF